MQMRRFRVSLGVLLLTAGLAACGGGGGGPDDVTGGGDGGGSGDLYAAYDRIGPGMSLAQVESIVGYGHNNGEAHYADRDDYNWIEGKGTSNVSAMTVSFTGGGVNLKIVAGAKGTFTQAY
ncbi:hypothetical protein [Hydrogenophaga sp.]|uniref:hypothetical protein n=1 Tax=Hydrogenophaga sp. TaxID=1904254 RepID=UPI0035B06B6E